MDAKPTFSIYDYLDYRKYLGDFYRYKKSVNPHFSHRVFAQRAGLKSSGYFSDVMSGRRNLSKSHVPKFAKALELGEREKIFFELMAAFVHAKSPHGKQSIYEQMLKAMPFRVQQIRQSQMEYFSRWYNVAVREALAITKIKGDGSELAEILDPPITPAQARASLRLLERLRLIARDNGGYWRANHASLLSPDEPGTAVLLRAFQREMLQRADEAIERIPAAHRESTSVTMSVSPNGMAAIKRLASEFHKRVLEAVQADRNEDRVIQMNLQVFPLTRIEDGNARPA